MPTRANARLAISLPVSDPPSLSLTYGIVSGPAHGTLSESGAHVVDAPAHEFPAPRLSGNDTFEFRVSNGVAVSGVAKVTIVPRSYTRTAGRDD